MKKYKIKKCIQCGEVIIKKKTVSINEYYKRKFCKSTCQYKWNIENKNIKTKCDYCGMTIKRRISAVHKHNFCSTKCSCKYKTLVNNKKVKCAWCGKIENRKLSIKSKKHFCSRKCMGLYMSSFCIDENGYGWRGGISSINIKVRALKQNTLWRKAVYERDNYICQICGDNKGGNLNAHHKITIKSIIEEYNIVETIDAIKCKKLWDINNGITLCESCHIKTHKEGND